MSRARKRRGREMERKIEEAVKIAEKQNWQFKPCPFCGSNDIGVKDTIEDIISEKDCPTVARRKIWAYCRYCGATSGTTIVDVIADNDEIAAALVKWNERSSHEKG